MIHKKYVRRAFATAALLLPGLAAAAPPPTDTGKAGVFPVDAKGRPLNLGFETGTLEDWKAEGDAFQGPPVEGDTVHARRSDMSSHHSGQYWVGSYERNGDVPQGTLTSVPFKVTHPFAKFLVGAGSHPTTRVEVVREETQKVIFLASGDDSEDLKPVAVDLTPHLGKKIFIRLVDRDSGGWGHVNFDDFRFVSTKPDVPPRPAPLVPDEYAHDGLSPTDAAAAMTVPEGFKVTLFAGEPDVVQPIAQAFDDRGRLWVVEAYSYPVRVPEAQARDRILIFEDKDGDGKFDSRKVFAEKLNLVSGLEIGFGGVWIGAAPNLLFIPDKDGDDRPDGPPQVLLDGWGYEDTHETLNSFNWGPDGWLYGCHGVFTHSRVGAPGTPDDKRVPINAGIWRYHPTEHRFEVFCHGTSNPWGVDFDERGQAFLTSCVIPHLYQVIDGARYERQAGPHFNPYTYDDIKTIADHRHYLGSNPHGGNGRSDGAGGGHAHAGAMIYLGGAWPEEYHGSIFMNNIHGARLNRDILVPQGSSFVGKHAPDFLLANDRWSQVVSLKYGPDGNLFMIDWYDKNQCHHHASELHDRTNGRIFKVSYRNSTPESVDLKALTSFELAKMQRYRNEWFVRHARRILQERGPDRDAIQFLKDALLHDPDAPLRLRGLWALHAMGALDDSVIDAGLADSRPDVRAWTIKLAAQNKGAASVRSRLAKLEAMSRTDASPIVRLALASVAQRLPLGDRWGIVAGLLEHSEDASDHNLPLMDWFAAEPLVESNPGRALALADQARIPQVQTFLVRRIASLGTNEAIASLVGMLKKTESAPVRLAILEGINESLKGRRQVAMPEAWPEVAKTLANRGDARIVAEAKALALTFGDPAALASMREVLANRGAELGLRRGALADLLRVHDPKLAPTLQSLVAESPLRGQALRALAAYDDANTPKVILNAYPSFSLAEKRDALSTLASRLEWARGLLAAVGSETVPSKDLSAEIIRQLRDHKSATLDAEIAKHWGTIRETAADKAKLIASMKAKLKANSGRKPDVELGRAVFAKTCQQCHTLFGTGGQVGPDLTGSNRADLDYVLANVLDPNALIGKDYQAQVISTTDGRVLTGIVKREDRDAVVLLSANDTVTIPKAEIDERRTSDKSMMPEDLLTPLAEHEIRSLVAYLASPRQVAMLANADNLPTFFNGRDLAGWQGDPRLWSVENGEIVGKTSGLNRNEFLRSELAVQDFRLTLQVKLVANQGNSGIQFRSESLPEGEVKGYQADVGEGWWGKLYEEHGRELLWPQSGEAYVKPGEWNTYEIVAVGDRIRTSINGHPCVRLDDPAGSRRGIFAIQLHAGGPTEVRYKDLRLELNPKAPE